MGTINWLLFIVLIITMNYTNGDNFKFNDADDFYKAHYTNCTLAEINQRKCINGVCITRTDLIERQPLCVCFAGWDGKRCAETILPAFFSKINSVIIISLAITLTITLIVICIYNYWVYTKKSPKKHNKKGIPMS